MLIIPINSTDELLEFYARIATYLHEYKSVYGEINLFQDLISLFTFIQIHVIKLHELLLHVKYELLM